MGPGGGKQSKGGRGVGYEGMDAQQNEDGGKPWEKDPDYCGVEPSMPYGELKFSDKPGGSAKRPEGSGGDDAKASMGGVD
jgi:hypothetical protein